VNRATLKSRLKIEEGDRLVAYFDSVGILTVGDGHNCKAKPVPGVEKPGDCITPGVRDQLLDDDIDDAAAELDAHLPWWRSLDDDRQNIMLDLCFNMGIGTLMGFQHTLAHIKAGLQDPHFFGVAADDLTHSLWHQQVGTRAVFLEGAMRTGVYA